MLIAECVLCVFMLSREEMERYIANRRDDNREELLNQVLDDPSKFARCVWVRVTERSIVEGLGVGRTQARKILEVLRQTGRAQMLYTVTLSPLWSQPQEPEAPDPNRLKITMTID
ncbi:MAG: hypothetical protein ABSA72_06425, partial [Nitrososphaerales archaeon]|jgi:hypothetical protein